MPAYCLNRGTHRVRKKNQNGNAGRLVLHAPGFHRLNIVPLMTELMGAVADAVLAAGSEVIGVLPEILSGSEIAHAGLTTLELVPTMHERKARMAELADAFLVLPGGYGTLDELMEAVTWAQLGLHAKPCILINTAGYWDGLLAFLDFTVTAGFLKAENRQLLLVAGSARDAIQIVTGN